MKRYYRKRHRIKKRKLLRKSRFFYWFFFLFFFFGISFYFVCLSSFFQIKEIKISGGQKIGLIEDLKNAIDHQINQKLILFHSKSIFLANLNKIRKAIIEQFPQISQINFKKKFPNILEVNIKERFPVAIFCQNEFCFLVDEEGIIFENNSSQNQLLKIQNLSQGQELKIGKEVIKKKILSSILEINSQLKNEFKIPLKEVLIFSEEKISVKTNEGWEIYFNPQKEIHWQLTKLKVVLEEEISPEKRKDLEYIDLRFGNFAPYRYLK